VQNDQDETMEIVVKGNNMFIVTQQMVGVDKETKQYIVGDIDQIELVMAHIPTIILYGLHVRIMQEVQSRARAFSTNIEVVKEVTELLQITCDQLNL
jgi:hypothetical protein